MSRRLLLSTTLAAALCFSFLSPSARAQTPERGFSLDLFGSYLTAHADGDSSSEESLGLRGSYRFTSIWAVEGALSRLDDDGEDAWIGDLSAKAYFLNSNRLDLYALAGAGLFRVVGEEETTLHLGLGAEIPLGDRAYLRPEARGRLLLDNLDAVTFVDYSLGVGWRF